MPSSINKMNRKREKDKHCGIAPENKNVREKEDGNKMSKIASGGRIRTNETI